MNQVHHERTEWIGHIVFIVAFVGVWELAARLGWLNPLLIGSPLKIAAYLREGFIGSSKLWVELGYTLLGTVISFVVGSVLAVATGMLFIAAPRFERFADPYLTLLNAIPRIALAPLFLLWFGLGLGSKVAVGVSLAFFIVLASTTAGIRGVSGDIVTLARSLGVSAPRIFVTITLPSAVPVIFSGLRLALVYSMLGVIGAELIAAEHGLGQVLSFLQANFDTSGVMALLLVLALLGLAVTAGMSWLEKHLLRWQ
jgi:NitT/TauT family transport system permease protein